MKQIRKALIPVAGLGTRFVPVTKTVPKEMLPIVDTPALLYIVEEAIAAGIEDIVLVSGRGKTAIEDFFDRAYELEDTLEKRGKTELLERVQRVNNLANIISIRQKEALGLGHAVYAGHPVIGEEPFAVLLGDELMHTVPGAATVTEQLAQKFKELQQSVIGVMEVPSSEVNKYGIIELDKTSAEEIMKVRSVIEKPDPQQAPSSWAIPGRYVFTPKIFDFLKNATPGKNGEIQLTDAMTQVAQSQGLWATTFSGIRYDTGDKLGYLKANVEFALREPQLGPAWKTYLLELADKLKLEN